MEPVILYPHVKYCIKLLLNVLVGMAVLSIILLASAIRGFPLALPILIIYLILTTLGILLYYNSLRYEILENEVVVYSGVLTKTVKHVPFRTMTNLQVTRTLVDRIFGLGSLDIQTAGAGGVSSPEEKLVGLGNVLEVYEYIAAELRRFQTGMSPTQAGNDVPRSGGRTYEQQILLAILEELRAIRAGMN